jgi:hypothetical protein
MVKKLLHKLPNKDKKFIVEAILFQCVVEVFVRDPVESGLKIKG